MRTNTAVQLRQPADLEKVWRIVSDPLDIDGEEGFERLTVEIPESAADLIERFAAYRNALAAAQGKKLKKQWSRKSMAENMLSAQVDALRHQLQDMVRAVGDLPPADDKEALEKFARRVLAWDKKQSK